MTRVFGAGSPEWNEAERKPRRCALADFVGIAIHCAQGQRALQREPNAKPDDSTIYPGSDDGYKALFGAKYVNPAITGGKPCVKATDGHDHHRPGRQLRLPRLRRRAREEHARRWSRRCRRTACR